MEKYHIPFAVKVSPESAQKIWSDMKVSVQGLSVRQTKALISDRNSLRFGFSVEPAKPRQKVALGLFGYPTDISTGQAQAILTDIYESLDLEVARYERLFEASDVIHLNHPGKITQIEDLDISGKVQLKNIQGRSCMRLIRRYRPDGDYSNTEIPDHYFENGWLKQVA